MAAKKKKRRPVITVTSTSGGTADRQVPDGNGSALLVCPNVATVRLPWWPTEVTRSSLGRTWDEVERPGRKPLLVPGSRRLDEFAINFTASADALEVPMKDWIDALEAIAGTTIPVTLVMAATTRGLFQVSDLSLVEVQHGRAGVPRILDASMTLKRASDATVKVGIIPRRRNKKGKKGKGD